MKKISVALCLLISAPELLNKGADAPKLLQTRIETVEETFVRIAQEYGAHAQHIGHAITRAESDFRNTYNTEGCRYGIGPMQIVKSTFEEQCVGDVYNTEDNIRCGLMLIEQRELWRWKQSAHRWLPVLRKDLRKYSDPFVNFSTSN